MVPTNMNVPGSMQDDKHNHYLTGKELGAILLTCYMVFSPPPSSIYTCHCPSKTSGCVHYDHWEF